MILPNSMVVPEKSQIPVSLKASSTSTQQQENSTDLAQMARVMAHLELTGWYWGSITAWQATQVLGDAPEGTFLLRKSSNLNYLFTLSVKTSLGPTHLRIEYCRGVFSFDSLVVARPRVQTFAGVVDLVQHYTLTCQRVSENKDKDAKQMASSPPKEAELQLRLIRPLYIITPSLQHLCRMVINQKSRNISHLPLPLKMKEYLQEYPFHV
ncbi:suppressor of cytokine signaling 2-like [Erpetoichthys calabaricus]|uniref:Suppressor of cytokine signaling 2-like n=1 Tax=Erpetoichthys calabaricus TaxID=27687 RepID=A0A8C4RSF1_ERPCA|nr:suppressor of cytokine signaling 2-like [Erpetoichthys calabaricus]